MNVYLSFRRVVLVSLMAILGLNKGVSVARAGDFRAIGTYEISQHGSHLEGTRIGHATAGGPFIGVFSGKWVGFNRGEGVGMLDFGRGDTLTYEWQAAFDEATGLLFGTWVIVGGTGKLTGASGSGVSIATEGEFEYVGSISW